MRLQADLNQRLAGTRYLLYIATSTWNNVF